jgi:phosphatidylglycerol:prolipoprotein diacylglycerol transferase
MRQILFTIPLGEIPIRGYGLMLVIGFLLAMRLARFLARRCGLNEEHFANAALLALLTGVVGARLSFVLENLGQFTRTDRSIWANLGDALNITSGGLTYYGGFLLAFPTLVWYALAKGVPLRLAMDISAPCILVGLGIGRIGCLLNGCCYGAECPADAFYALRFPYHSLPYLQEWQGGQLHQAPPSSLVASGRLLTPGEVHQRGLDQLAAGQRSNPRHPAQLYSTITALLLAGVCLACFTVRRTVGLVFAFMLMLEGAARCILEMLRAEPAVWGRMSLSMLLGMGLTALGIALALLFRWLDRHAYPAP